MKCDDCHMAQTTAGGTRYTIHDHMFDFSQPEVACGECHDEGYEGKEIPRRGTSSTSPKVDIPQNLTLPEACVRCHEGKSTDWAEERYPRTEVSLPG